uniref:Uncharacterized protein n=1 Tax=Attheya septentrionalis TaxID=420275 RepID=A0A7S2UKQ9_9STRA|mmetsp:Transcript_27116/g.49331  ORF Transcript_27116/g.49331 Transcript_27116/m.49331 type:complete len:102 (+) Transcript_27116:56-361(+)|eukprot:CAMPEP_0198280260 /NCGR_PEP_ID=MMETSP1449-20131203/369_1 /TAXON_ID=420275 /ORGANISM="Attheya septentrionalis, Strain CCMP2084" /LENGTH=101 /DNA_ID=CAMNT_0043975563 /DNA_START=57 /DNA_END=362 /DNA_ORIENTATION=+
MCGDVGTTSRLCLFYSVCGAIFTGWVGIMIGAQPFFIAGIDNPDEAQASAFGAMGMFAFAIVASMGGIWYDGQSKIEEIETPEGYQLNSGGMTEYGTSRYD